VASTDEAITVIRTLWTPGQVANVTGEHHPLSGVHTGPKPAHDIGIWLGAVKPRMLYIPSVTAKTLSRERREGRWYVPAASSSYLGMVVAQSM
jgi:hypothetical protein